MGFHGQGPGTVGVDEAFAGQWGTHIVVVPIILGRGERLWDGLEGLEERFTIEAVGSPSGVVHLTLARREPR